MIKGRKRSPHLKNARSVQFVLYVVDSIYLRWWEKRGQTASTTAPRVWSSAVELSPCLHILLMGTTVQQKLHPRPWPKRTSLSHSCHTIPQSDSRYSMYLSEDIVTLMRLDLVAWSKETPGPDLGRSSKSARVFSGICHHRLVGALRESQAGRPPHHHIAAA